MRFSELKSKDVINLRDCKKLGRICDLEFDECSGKICKVINSVIFLTRIRITVFLIRTSNRSDRISLLWIFAVDIIYAAKYNNSVIKIVFSNREDYYFSEEKGI